MEEETAETKQVLKQTYCKPPIFSDLINFSKSRFIDDCEFKWMPN